MFLESPVYIDIITARLRSTGSSPVFIETLYSRWRRWTRLLVHCLRTNAGNSSGPIEEFCENPFIASMMSTLVILISESVIVCECPKKSLGYLYNSHCWLWSAEDAIV